VIILDDTAMDAIADADAADIVKKMRTVKKKELKNV